MKTLARSLAVLILSACTPQPPEHITYTPGPAIDPARIASHVRVLASDEFLGRGPATAGEEKTVAYIAEQFRAAGLQPGGPNGSWYQKVPLNESDIVGRPELAFNVGGRRQSLTQGEQIAVRATMQNIDCVAIDRAPVVFLGYGVKAPERNWDDFKGMDPGLAGPRSRRVGSL